jgi:hypothetical protein
MAGRSSRGPIVGIWLLALVGTALVGFAGCSVEPDIDVSVGRGSAEGPLTVYVPTCRPSGTHVISLSELVGGSRTSGGVPIYWQIASRAGSRRAVYTVGGTNPGFFTSVPLVERLARGPGDFYEIEVDGTGGGGFTFSDPRRAQVVTSGECRTQDNAGERWIIRLVSGLLVGVAFFILIWVVLFVVSRFMPAILDPARGVHRQTVAAALAVSVAAVGVLTALGEPHQAGLPKNLLPRGVPKPGPLSPSLQEGQQILAEFDSNDAPGDQLATTEFTARGRYALYVGCSGVSVQVSEGFEGYGARTVALCNPTVAVPTALDVSPNGTVTLGVVPNGTRRWRVTVATP